MNMIGPCCSILMPQPDSFWFHHNPVIGAAMVSTVKVAASAAEGAKQKTSDASQRHAPVNHATELLARSEKECNALCQKRFEIVRACMALFMVNLLLAIDRVWPEWQTNGVYAQSRPSI